MANDKVVVGFVGLGTMGSRMASNLQKAGFKREGMARRYLKINGLWQDHDLFALLQDDARA